MGPLKIPVKFPINQVNLKSIWSQFEVKSKVRRWLADTLADTANCLQTRNYVNYVVLSMLARVIQDFGVCEIVVIEKGPCPQLSTVNAYMHEILMKYILWCQNRCQKWILYKILHRYWYSKFFLTQNFSTKKNILKIKKYIFWKFSKL